MVLVVTYTNVASPCCANVLVPVVAVPARYMNILVAVVIVILVVPLL